MIKEYHVSENLYNYATNETGYRIQWTTGNAYADETAIMIDYIPVSVGNYSLDTGFIIVGYDTNKAYVGVYRVEETWEMRSSQQVTLFKVAANSGVAYVKLLSYGDYPALSSTNMLNTGSTALPYEPYGNTWNTKSYCKATTGSKTYSNFPIVVRSQEQSISSWNMKGNEQHIGTASPTSPIEINGTGERTANLSPVGSFTITAHDTSRRVDIFSGTLETGNYVVALNQDNAITGSTRNTLQVTVGGTTYYNSSNANYHNQSGQQKMTFTVAETGNVDVKYWANDLNENCSYSNITFNAGSEVINEPYGYKIPISANGTALSPVYLTEQLMKIGDYADSLASSGTVTYQIKKIVLTGSENWTYHPLNPSGYFRYLFSQTVIAVSDVGICTHYTRENIGTATVGTDVFTINAPAAGGNGIVVSPTGIENMTTDSWKTYLAEQYAAGTPVTVWYILATPTTEQVTVPTIPTISSPTTIDVNTSVKPSEMSLTYDGYKICKPTKIVIPEPSEWIAKSWNGYNRMVGSSIWSDGNNIYYSMAMDQYVLNKSTSTWSTKTWNGLTSFNGAHIWTDGDNIYYSFGNDQYVLNRQTSTWSAKTWNGLASFDGGYVWTDGNNVYYSNSSNQYILDKATSTWVEKEWNGLTSFDGSDVWFEGNNIYYSHYFTRYILNKSTSTWSEKVWTNAPYYMYGVKIWSVNGYTFYSNGTYEQYVLDKSTSTWSTKTWTGFTSFSGTNIWTDGINIYASDGIGKQYVLVR